MIPTVVIKNAACKGHSNKEFYPRKRKGVVNLPPDHVCFRCPVREECLEHGLHNEPYGVWGGRTEEELYHMREALGIPQPPIGIGVIVINGRPQ